MLYEEIEKKLSDAEAICIRTLEGFGYQIMTEARIDDCKKKDGGRMRTFSLSGRYDLAIALKLADRKPHPEEIKIETAEEVIGVQTSENTSSEGDSAFENENFWKDRRRWIRMSSEKLKEAAFEKHAEDFKQADETIQDEVKRKILES